MSLELTTRRGGDVLEVEVSGKLERADYERFVPRAEESIAAHGAVRVLLVMRDFHGWTAGALWEDLKFDLKHFADVERLALVGEERWQKGMAAFTRPFTRAEVRWFDLARLQEAREWARAE